MKKLLEQCYFRFPLFLQNAAVSLYGLRVNQIRHGVFYEEFGKSIAVNLKASAKEIEIYQIDALRLVLKECLTHVPYYREYWSSEGINLDDINGVDDIRKIPFLEKEILRSKPESLVSDAYSINSLKVIHTTGTTGTPLRIYCNSQVRQRNYAFYQRFLGQIGIPYEGGMRATFGGRLVVSHGQSTPPFWRYSRFQNNYLFSSYHLTDRNIPFYIRALQDIRPNYIDSYPSSLFTLACYAKKHDISLSGVTKAITTSAETLFDDQRQLIEEVFGVRIFDQYGAAEMCVFVGQCCCGNYHLHCDYALVEFLREDGTCALPGEEAEVVCTSLINPVMPLIRYRIGDRAILGRHQCDCNSPFPVIERILGRADDIILTPDGRRVGRLSPVLKGFPVKEVQYRQLVKDEVEVHIVKDIMFADNDAYSVEKELRKRVGDEIKIKILFPDKIDKSAGGKLKSIVSFLE